MGDAVEQESQGAADVRCSRTVDAGAAAVLQVAGRPLVAEDETAAACAVRAARPMSVNVP